MNPLISYSIRSDGVITVYAQGETGEKSTLRFDNLLSIRLAIQALKDAIDTLDIFNGEGYEAAAEYLELSCPAGIKTSDIHDLLEGGPHA
jgi:hypothetical protein